MKEKKEIVLEAFNDIKSKLSHDCQAFKISFNFYVNNSQDHEKVNAFINYTNVVDFVFRKPFVEALEVIVKKLNKSGYEVNDTNILDELEKLGLQEDFNAIFQYYNDINKNLFINEFIDFLTLLSKIDDVYLFNYNLIENERFNFFEGEEDCHIFTSREECVEKIYNSVKQNTRFVEALKMSDKFNRYMPN